MLIRILLSFGIVLVSSAAMICITFFCPIVFPLLSIVIAIGLMTWMLYEFWAKHL